jgi:hypothetical protein
MNSVLSALRESTQAIVE